jgi:hypothetical protein
VGDHRATVKISFDFHGKVYEMDSWINWTDYGSECSGVDQRVIDFFREAAADGLARYNLEVLDYWAEQAKKRQETSERAELVRLKGKYPDG